MSEFYESDRAVSEYLFFHFGDPARLLPWEFGPTNGLNYPVRCVTDLLDVAQVPGGARALDLGCAVGRSSFELARHCDEVIGIDYSHRFVAEATALKEKGRHEYAYVIEGDLTATEVAAVDSGIDCSRVSFEQGDAGSLRDGLGELDVVLMANLLCRLPDPAQCLGQMAKLIKTGGQLLITTPCTWLEEYTPREKWLGGFERDGIAVRTIDSLHALLGGEFELRQRSDLPFLIREHERKFQWTVAEGSSWVRK
jgi:putative 4-mercaptohistidine N1-methyltranferase